MTNHHTFFTAAVLAVGALTFAGCEKSETGSTSGRSPSNSRASENTPANTAREAQQAAHNVDASAGATTGASDVTRTTNVEQNSTNTAGAGSTDAATKAGPTTRPAR